MGFDCTKPQRPVWHAPALLDLVTFAVLGGLLATVGIAVVGEGVGDFLLPAKVLLAVLGVAQLVMIRLVQRRNDRLSREWNAFFQQECVQKEIPPHRRVPDWD